MIFTRRFGALVARRTLVDVPETQVERPVDRESTEVERDQVAHESAA